MDSEHSPNSNEEEENRIAQGNSEEQVNLEQESNNQSGEDEWSLQATADCTTHQNLVRLESEANNDDADQQSNNHSEECFWPEEDDEWSLQATAEATTTDQNLAEQVSMELEHQSHQQTGDAAGDKTEDTPPMIDETSHYNWDPNEEDNWDYTDEDLTRGKVFHKDYPCLPLGPETQGTRIIMPASALEQIMASTIQFPMVFEVTNPSSSSNKVSHCGVLEFSSAEGSVWLPPGMMENLKLEMGQLVSLKGTSLPQGTFMKIQPHTTEFTELSNPRAVLERALRDFSCVTTGDTILVNHGNKKYYINILETKPTNAISLVDTDCYVDFAPPLDYKEPEKKPLPVKAVVQEEGSKEEPQFRAFSGASRRLDGRQSTAPAMVDIVQASTSSKVEKKENRLQQPALRWTSKENPASTSSKVDKKELTTKHDEPKFQPFTGKKYTLA